MCRVVNSASGDVLRAERSSKCEKRLMVFLTLVIVKATYLRLTDSDAITTGTVARGQSSYGIPRRSYGIYVHRARTCQCYTSGVKASKS